MTLEGPSRLFLGPTASGRRGIEAALTAPEIDIDRCWCAGAGHVRRHRVRVAARRHARAQGRAGLVRRRRGQARRRRPMRFDQQRPRDRAARDRRFRRRDRRRQRRDRHRDARTPRGALTLDLDARALDGMATRGGARFAPARPPTRLRREAPRSCRPSCAPRWRSTPMSHARRHAGGAKLRSRSRAMPAPSASTCKADAGASQRCIHVGQSVQARVRQDQSHRPDRRRRWQCAGRVPRPRCADRRSTSAPGDLNVTASGPLDGDIAVDRPARRRRPRCFRQWHAAHSPAGQGPTAGLGVKVVERAMLQPLARTAGGDAAGRAHARGSHWPTDIAALSDLAGNVAGTDVSGRLSRSGSRSR